MKEALGLLLVLLLITGWFLFLSDGLISVQTNESEVEVVALCYDRPNQKRTNKVVVKWEGRLMVAEVDAFKAGGLKPGDKVVVEIRKGWLFGGKREPQVKED